MADYSDMEDYRKQESIAFADSENNSSEHAQSVQPPAQTFGPSKAPIQKKDPEPSEPKTKDKSDDKGLDVDIKLLPPKIQLAFWRFKLSADKGEAKLAYKQGDFNAGLGYGYGSSLNLGVSKGPFSGKAAYKPGDSDFSLGAGYKQGAFNAGLSVNPLGKSAALSVGIGSPLLPMPDAFGSAMQAGGDAATNMMMQGPQGATDNPMGYYKKNKAKIGDITKAVGMAQKLAKHKKGVNLGAGLRLSASELGGFSFSLAAQGYF